jgi:outer membrane protein OmpA-like peptidoglycan-associated protein
MAFESMSRKASAALAASAYALCVGAAPVVQAQLRTMAQPTTVGFRAPSAAIPERIVLHGVRFQARSDKIDESSLPLLDYAIQAIKANPEYLVYVKVMPFIQHSSQSDRHSNSELIARRTEAVASYFAQKGLSAEILVLLAPDGVPYAFNEGTAKIQNLKNSEMLQLDFAIEADLGTGPS